MSGHQTPGTVTRPQGRSLYPPMSSHQNPGMVTVPIHVWSPNPRDGHHTPQQTPTSGSSITKAHDKNSQPPTSAFVHPSQAWVAESAPQISLQLSRLHYPRLPKDTPRLPSSKPPFPSIIPSRIALTSQIYFQL